MIFSINQKDFIKDLEEVYKAIDSLNYYLPLRNFYIDIQMNKILIHGTNGKLSIEKIIELNPEIEIHEMKTLLIPSTLFLNIIKKCSNKIIFELKNENLLIIKNGKDLYEINLLNVEEFPPIDFSLYGNKININGNKLKQAIDNVVFATSQKEEDFILNGVNLKLENNNLLISATDSYRLAQEKIEINDDRNLTFDVTIFNKNIKHLIPSDINDKEVTLYVNEHKVNLIANGFNIQSTVLDAIYKDISKIFDLNYNKKLIVNKNIFSNAINKATVIAGDTYNKIRLEISNEEVKLISIKDEVGSSKVVLDSEQFRYEGEPIIITLNFKYLKEAISVFEEEIEINMNNPEGIILITSQNSTNKQIVCPLKSY